MKQAFKKIWLFIVCILGVFLLYYKYCGRYEKHLPKHEQEVIERIQRQKQMMEEFNKGLVKQENESILKYIENSGNEYVETGTGLRYRIINQGEGDIIKTGDIVALDYELRLLNGDLLYSSDENGRKVFEVGHGGVESGLEEAILHLHRGGEAEIIIPARLAHGLTGDGDRIPPKSTIVYKVKVIENQTNNYNN